MRHILRWAIRIALAAVVFAVSLYVGMGLRGWVDRRSAWPHRFSQITDSRVGASAAQLGSAEAATDVSPVETFRDVIEMVRSEYVEKVTDETKLASGAVRTMLYALDDTATRYWSPEQFDILKKQLEGEYAGIGAVLAVAKIKRNDVEQRRVMVVAPVADGPAARAGIRSGDYITEIGGRWIIAYDPRLDLNRLTLRTMPDTEYRKILRNATKKLTDGISWPRALETLLQPKDAELKLTIERPGAAQPLHVTVKPEPARVQPVEFRTLKNNIGYLRVALFSQSAPQRIKDALAQQGRLNGLIVDLRDNPGGPDYEGPRSVVRSMTTSLEALGIHGQIAAIAKGTTKRRVTAASDGKKPAQMVVLTNKGTANVAEVAAEAARVLAGARIVGSTTRGDGAYQKLVPLKIGAMTLTAGKWLTAGGRPIASTGLAPDIAVSAGSPAGVNDPVVSRAVTLLAGKGGGA